ncbi:MAG: hypothetical protein NTV06_02970, partial [candidate division Zixibacteria bacterium]|nr:hypothetical protein [candidate division Zixibacteria bacterium]
MSKILLLLNLLHHRRAITPEEIKRICRISARSVYRYLNTISAGHFPVVFDRNLRGYRLLEKSGVSVDKLKLDEVIIITTALEQISKIVNSSYRHRIESILAKIFSSQGGPLEEIWQASKERLENEDFGQDLSDSLTQNIIHAAIRFDKKLSVHTIDIDSETKGIEVDSPHLVFDQGWQLKGKGTENG